MFVAATCPLKEEAVVPGEVCAVSSLFVWQARAHFWLPGVRANRNRGLPVGRQPYVDPVARHDLGRMEHACPKCRTLHWLDERIQKTGSTNLHPLFGMCCGDGTIQLPAPAPAPEPLQHFFSATTSEARRFCENIHQYNVALSFTSLGARVDVVPTPSQSGRRWCPGIHHSIYFYRLFG